MRTLDRIVRQGRRGSWLVAGLAARLAACALAASLTIATALTLLALQQLGQAGLAEAELAALSRWAWYQYGLRAEGKDLMDMYLNTRAQGFGSEVNRRILLGTYTLSSGYYEAYYKKAQQVRTLIKQDFEDVFRHVDLLVTPTTPTAAFKSGEKTAVSPPDVSV